MNIHVNWNQVLKITRDKVEKEKKRKNHKKFRVRHLYIKYSMHIKVIAELNSYSCLFSDIEKVFRSFLNSFKKQ